MEWTGKRMKTANRMRAMNRMDNMDIESLDFAFKEVWARQFKDNPECNICPFVKNTADVGVGTITDCDKICTMSVAEIVREMDNFL